MKKTVHNFLKRHCINTKKLIICFALLFAGVIISILARGNYQEQGKIKAPTVTHTQTEQKLCDILQKMQGVGEVDVMVTYKEEKSSGYFDTAPKEDASKIQGVVVVATGAESDKVKSDITYAVSALLDVELCNIKVYKQN